MIYVAGTVDSPFERMWVLAPRMSKGMGSTPIRISPMKVIAQGNSLGILRGVELWAGSIKDAHPARMGAGAIPGTAERFHLKVRSLDRHAGVRLTAAFPTLSIANIVPLLTRATSTLHMRIH